MTPSDDQRLVRTFISSTFADMQREREHLVKFVFPELRRRCRERGVEFTEVDLRWGITEEQKAEGKVLPICLAEIDGCRPYFLGILGERYGWVPDEISEALVQEHPWLAEHKEKSVTALEIIHGVLNRPEMKTSAFFYFRSPETSRKVEETLTKTAGYAPEPESSRLKMRLLKEKIIQSGCPRREDYPDPGTLGRFVLEDLWTVIDRKFPKEKVPSSLDRERSEHEAFATAKRKVYIRREEYFRRLEEHVEGDYAPLVVLGGPGSGKSALLANWIQEYRQRHPEDFLVSHFIGSTPESANYAQMLRRIMEEIKLRCGEEEEIPQDPRKAADSFPLWLARVGSRGRFILILDALDQLEEIDNAPDLTWLPKHFPPGVRVIFSTLPGRSLEAIKERWQNSLTVQPLNLNEKIRMIEEYLGRFRKSLSQEQVDKISRAETTSNPLYLKALLDELRVFGYHARLDERIGHYLAAETVAALYEKILERCEGDYERDRPGLIREALCLIWASRRGLSERELLELMGTDGRAMPQAFWSPLLLALGESLVSLGGFLGFGHDFLRQGVENRHLSDSEAKGRIHLRLADYFDRYELVERKAEELPWQLYRAESWARLKSCLVNPAIFVQLNSEKRRYELYGYWLRLKNEFDLGEACAESIGLYERSGPSPSDLANYLDGMILFLNLNERYDFSESLNRKALAIREKDLGPDHPETATSLNNLAELLYLRNDLKAAGPLFQRALAIRKERLGPGHPMTARSLRNLGGLLKAEGNLALAERCYAEALELNRKTVGEEHPETAKILNNLALLYNKTGNPELSDSLLRKAIAIREKTLGPHHPETATALVNLGQVRIRLRDPQGAEECFRRALSIMEKSLGPEHDYYLGMLTNLAELLRFIKDYERAEPLYRNALSTTERKCGATHLKTAEAMNKLAVLLDSRSEYSEAESLYLRALAVREKIQGSGHVGLLQNLSQLADHYADLKDYRRAEVYAGRALLIAQQALGANHPQTASCHKMLIWIRQQMGQ